MKLSIITINRNNAQGLRKTIESVISQTFTDFEYLIIDGASTDGSTDVIKQYEDKITYWISEPDKGIYNAMNKGILKAVGAYCLFLNSGDALSKDSILSDVFNKEYNSDILCGYVSGKRNNENLILYPPRQYTFRFLYGHNIPHQAEFIRRKLLIELGLYNETYKILSDYDFNIRSLLYGAVIENLDYEISIIEMNGISNDDKNNQLLIEEGQLIFNNLIPKSIMEDYIFFLDKKTYSHPAISWLINRDLYFYFVKFIYKIFKR